MDEPESAHVFGLDFEDDLDRVESDPDSPKAVMAFVSPTQKLVRPVRLDTFHVGNGPNVKRRGLGLSIEGFDKQIRLPFLITNILETEVVGDKLVQVRLTERGSDVLSRPWGSGIYPVKTDAWFGLARLEEDGRIRLLAFSDQRDAKIQPGQELYFTEWGGTDLVGTITFE
jgi:hypothetical protein